jgi:hypothetical protein
LQLLSLAVILLLLFLRIQDVLLQAPMCAWVHTCKCVSYQSNRNKMEII